MAYAEKPDFTLSPEEWDRLIASLGPLPTGGEGEGYPPPTPPTENPLWGGNPNLDFITWLGTHTEAEKVAFFGKDNPTLLDWMNKFKPVTPKASPWTPPPPPSPTPPTGGEGTQYNYDEAGNQYFWNPLGRGAEGEWQPTGMYDPSFDRRVKKEAVPPGLSAEELLAWETTLLRGYTGSYDDWVNKGSIVPPEPPTPVTPITPYQQGDIELQRQRLAQEQAQWGQQLGWYKEQQAAQLAAEKEQRLATLRAQPKSWLEYASLAGETPGVQPWMLPLMSQQYMTPTTGQPIPGWKPEGSLVGQLPTLTTPSTQYQARIGPTAQQQYYGYQQAATGAPPEETQWRLWNMAPPSGSFQGLRYSR